MSTALPVQSCSKYHPEPMETPPQDPSTDNQNKDSVSGNSLDSEQFHSVEPLQSTSPLQGPRESFADFHAWVQKPQGWESIE